MNKNAAQRLMESIGAPIDAIVKQAHGNKNASASKRGPGRYAESGKPGNRLSKDRKTRAYVALTAAWASKRVPNWKGDTDPTGAYTLIGRRFDPETGEYLRRKWLAGISAQRGY